MTTIFNASKKTMWVWVLLACALPGCKSEKEKKQDAMQHAQALDIMRKKAHEIVLQQQDAILVAIEDLKDWEDRQQDLSKKKKDDLNHARLRLRYWQGWHLEEQQRHNAIAEADFIENELTHWENGWWKIRSKMIRLEASKARADRAIKSAEKGVEAAPYESVKELRQDYLKKKIADRKNIIVLIGKEQAKLDSYETTKPTFKPLPAPPPKTNEIQTVQTTIKRITKEIDSFNAEYSGQQQKHLENLQKMKQDLLLSQTTLDSLNALHTEAVKELSKVVKE